MNSWLLAYLCAGQTVIVGYCLLERRNATSYRGYVRPLLTDMQETHLLTLEDDLQRQVKRVRRDVRDLVVAGVRHEQQKSGEEDGGDAVGSHAVKSGQVVG